MRSFWEAGIKMNKRKAMIKASPPVLKRLNAFNGGNGNGSRRVKKLMREIYGGEPYEFYRLGRYIVSAPGVCSGRPTFKYTRIDVRHALGLLSAGRSIETVANDFGVPIPAVREAVKLASKALDRQETHYAKAA